MLQELINKDVEVIVAFGGYTVSGGSTPEKYIGKLINVDDEFCKLYLLKSKRYILIAIKFILTIKEM